MSTFVQIKTDVQQLVIDLPTTVSSAVGSLVNGAIRSMQREYNYRAMEQSDSFVTTVGSIALGTIANFKEYRDKGPYMLKKLTRARKLITALSTDVDQAVLADVNYPLEPAYIINSVSLVTGSWTFTLSPYPDNLSDWSDGNYRIIIPSYIYTADLVSDGDQNWFTQNAADYITYKATAEAFGRNWDYDSMAVWLQRASEKLKEIKKADKMSRLASVDTLVPMWRGANQPQVRN